jgi:hypothetical protein
MSTAAGVERREQRLPPGPRLPMPLQMLRWRARPVEFMESCRARYGDLCTIRLALTGPVVYVSDPALIRRVLTASTDVFRAGEDNAVFLGSIIGEGLLALDGRRHLVHRRLMLPLLHEDRVRSHEGTIQAVTERHLARWLVGRPFAIMPAVEAILREVALRVLFGLEEEAQIASFTRAWDRLLRFSVSPFAVLPWFRFELGGLTAWGRFVRVRDDDVRGDRPPARRRPGAHGRPLPAAGGEVRRRLAHEGRRGARRDRRHGDRGAGDERNDCRVVLRPPSPRPGRRWARSERRPGFVPTLVSSPPSRLDGGAKRRTMSGNLGLLLLPPPALELGRRQIVGGAVEAMPVPPMVCPDQGGSGPADQRRQAAMNRLLYQLRLVEGQIANVEDAIAKATVCGLDDLGLGLQDLVPAPPFPHPRQSTGHHGCRRRRLRSGASRRESFGTPGWVSSFNELGDVPCGPLPSR